MGRPIPERDRLYLQFLELPVTFGIPTQAVEWFFEDFRRRKRGYDIQSFGALWRMVSEDLPMWIKRHGSDIQKARQAERVRASYAAPE